MLFPGVEGVRIARVVAGALGLGVDVVQDLASQLDIVVGKLALKFPVLANFRSGRKKGKKKKEKDQMMLAGWGGGRSVPISASSIPKISASSSARSCRPGIRFRMNRITQVPTKE